jgi:hypothetical protein
VRAGVAGREAADARQHWYPTGGGPHNRLDEGPSLGCAELRELPDRAERDEAIDPAWDEILHQLDDRVIVKAAVSRQRREQCGPKT